MYYSQPFTQKNVSHQLPRESRPIFVWNVFIVVTIYTHIFPDKFHLTSSVPNFSSNKKPPPFGEGKLGTFENVFISYSTR